MTRAEGGEIDFTLVGTLQTKGIGASSMEVALGSLPTGVNLTDVDSAEGTLTINGIAPNADKVFSYLRALEASGKFAEITVTNMTRTGEGGMTFSLVLKTGG
jgi:Tfp pilus assembly protein PilN